MSKDIIDTDHSIDETVTDMGFIKTMINLARENGLETEVIWSFYQAAKSGDSITQAVGFALSEWDI